MNFREEVISRIAQLLERLVIEDSQTQDGPESDILYLTPNQNYNTPLRQVLLDPIESATGDVDVPTLWVSFDGGRNDLGARTFNSHLVEVLSIRLDLVLSKKCGLEDEGKVRPITLQISDALADIQKILTVSMVTTAVTTPQAQVNSLYLGEWTLDERFRGGEQEVLNIRLDLEVENPLEVS